MNLFTNYLIESFFYVNMGRNNNVGKMPFASVHYEGKSIGVCLHI